MWVPIVKTTLEMSIMRCVPLILTLLLPTSTAAADSSNVLCVLVEHAQIARHRPDNEGKFGRSNSGHQIANGARSVLAIRVYENGSGPPDSQLFKKATLEIKLPTSIPLGEAVNVNVLRSYYTEGASAWVSSGGYSWTSDPFPQVTLRRSAEGLSAQLKLLIESKNESRFAKHRRKERIQVDLQCPIKMQTVNELTPWIGKVGTSTDSFFGPTTF
jgi:hypothetical protein